MRPSRRLVRTFVCGPGAPRSAIEVAAPVKDPPICCSDAMFGILSSVPLGRTVLSISEGLGIPPSMHRDIAKEAFDLWQRRAIDLNP
jgi:hypothetical protein